MIAFLPAAVESGPQIVVRPEIQKILDTAPAWPGMVLAGIVVLWVIASIFVPFFLWGIYSASYKQTKLLREIADQLRRTR